MKRHRPYGIVTRQYSSLNYISVRIGSGLQKDFYSEVGLSFQMRNFSDVFAFSRSYYTALEVIPNFNQNESQSKNVYGIKMGIEAYRNVNSGFVQTCFILLLPTSLSSIIEDNEVGNGNTSGKFLIPSSRYRTKKKNFQFPKLINTSNNKKFFFKKTLLLLL